MFKFTQHYSNFRYGQFVCYTCKLAFYLCPRTMGANKMWMKTKELNKIGSFVNSLKFMLKEHKNVHICVLKLLNFIILFFLLFKCFDCHGDWPLVKMLTWWQKLWEGKW
jgi:hypothetical protein